MPSLKEEYEALKVRYAAERCVCQGQRPKVGGNAFCARCLKALDASDEVRTDKRILSQERSSEQIKPYRRCLGYLQEQGYVRAGVKL